MSATSNGGKRPRILDLCCGAGGASLGYKRAGWEPVGVDIAYQPNYPFEKYVQDALVFLEDVVGWDGFEFDAFHASVPCQTWTAYRRIGHGVGDGYPDLISAMREALTATGKLWVMENVPGAPLRDPITLCGSMFGLDIRRHRLFETNWPLLAPQCDHFAQVAKGKRFPGATNRDGRFTCEIGVWRIPLKTQIEAMGLDPLRWPRLTLEELSEMIPPAYTHWIGVQMLAHLRKAQSLRDSIPPQREATAGGRWHG